jgi:hypothetical protein
MNGSNYKRRTPVTRGEINTDLEGTLNKGFETLFISNKPLLEMFALLEE